LFNAAGIATGAFADFVVGHGELWNALLLSAACKGKGGDAVFMDARQVLVVSSLVDPFAFYWH
jgi:aspartokinase/homoserine dehydrogenase 1